jgi:acyl-CoA synthetase (AMP-forming)/AMP-acid ligase II
VIHASPWPPPDVPAVTLTGHLLAAAARWGDAPALIEGPTGVTTTFAALARAVPAAAADVVAAGVSPGDVVALIGPNRPAWAIGLHAALAAGAAVAPMNPASTVDELARQMRATRAVAAVVDEGAEERVQRAAALAGAIPVLLLSRLAEAAGRRTGNGSGPAVLPPPVDPGSVAVLPFSSGTTGLPKVVQLTHRNLVANLEQHRVIQHLGADDVLLAVVPFFHSYGLTLVLHIALVQGAAVVTLPRFELDAYLAAIEKHRVTRLHVAPPVLRALADLPAADRRARDLSSVNVVVCGAAPLDPALAARVSDLYGIPVIQGYGMTEASPGTHYTPDGCWESVPAGSVGWLVPGTEARIEPVEDGSTGSEDGSTGSGSGTEAVGGDAAGGERGELWLRGPQVMAGYLDAPEATAATIDAGGWLRTGDVVRVDADGCFFVVDRVKELIKYKGYQVAPAELEAVVLGHPAVRDVAVVGVADPVAGELPKAFVVADGDLVADELTAWVAERVAPHKKIRLVEQVDAIPRSPTGKILRRLLRDGGAVPRS